MIDVRNPSIIETIKSRSSRRSYHSELLSQETVNQIEKIVNDAPNGLFNSTPTFRLIHKSMAADQKIKLGTYGFISGAQYFIAGKTVSSPEALVDFGYRMEWIILQLTALGLGTCWLGGTFKRGEFAGLLDVKEDEIIPAITPVGHTTEKRSMRDKIIRIGAGSNKRKPWPELFFDRDFKKPLGEITAGKYAQALEMVRLAPSASNRQPWRIVMIGNEYHFYLLRTPGYGRMFPEIDLQRVDLGIAICHFELTARELSMTGSWKYLQTDIHQSDELEYITSWKAVI